MNGIFKAGLITIPALGLVIYLGWFKVEEHSKKMEVESASFDRDWNEGMAERAKTKAMKKKYEDRATAAQVEFDNAQGDLKLAKKKTDQIGRDLEHAKNETDAQDLDRELKQMGKGAK